MKRYMNFKTIVAAVTINLLAILTIFTSKTLIELTKAHQGAQGADIGGGLMILLTPIASCFLIGMWRGKKEQKLF